MSSSSREARRRKRKESTETRAEIIVIIPRRYGDGAKISRLHRRFGVLSMDRSPFTVRIKAPANLIFPPHYTPNPETVTVISGELLLGIGDKFDKEKAQRMTAGSF